MTNAEGRESGVPQEFPSANPEREIRDLLVSTTSKSEGQFQSLDAIEPAVSLYCTSRIVRSQRVSFWRCREHT